MQIDVSTEHLIYRQISWDTLHCQSGEMLPAEISLFVDRQHAKREPVTRWSEKQAVEWLLKHDASRQLFFEELGRTPTAFCATRLIEPFYSPSTGDIDLLLCERGAPHQAIAMECKCVKVAPLDPPLDKVNKLEDAAKGVCQANKLLQLGLFQTYFTIITLVDAGQQKKTNIPCRGIHPDSTSVYSETKTFSRIIHFPGREDLHPDVGIVFIELVQASGVSFEEMGTFRVCLRPATPQPQTETSTNRIRSLMGIAE